MNIHRSPQPHSNTPSKRGLALARKVRARELDAARARDARERRTQERRRALQAKARRQQGQGRVRVELEAAEGERTLVIRGPHTDFDLWMLTGILGACVALPATVGLFFVHWLVGLGSIVLLVAGWLFYVYSPVLITVTDNGYFEARRPFLPSRDLGTVDELELELSVDGNQAAGFYRRCTIESKRWRLWTVHRLTPTDEATIEAFKRSLVAAPAPRPHEGGYRRAA